ncbi:MAG: hypothetical protein QF603_19030 [Alphaproteobacteria bacterium]|jgi:NADPH-dependent 7-cyano-7-deazaguanine reductase QueF|nr:hypothetical protein [Rhodospirillaceae bacterium]MDP7230650.1 hypothetical protein [Alphaproteobacteria bacterium]|tara:strand:+ start:426 stop:824 length:399 start_codon:yes stop_codon:yes gene_type:complete
MDILTRRSHIETTRNPDERLDYLVTLNGTLQMGKGASVCHVVIRYIPDQHILSPESFARYLKALGGIEWSHLEEAAAAILEDMGNEVVARWIQVNASTGSEDPTSVPGHQVVLEDKQPQWENPGLLARLGMI